MNRFASRELSMLIALVAIWAFFAWQEPVFLSARNLSLLSVELAVTAVLALGMLVVLLPGQKMPTASAAVRRMEKRPSGTEPEPREMTVP